MNDIKLRNMLGLAQRAGRLLRGDFSVERQLKRGAVPLLLIATDCAPNTAEKYNYLAMTQKVPVRQVLTKDELGECIGKARRAAVIVNDAGFAKAILTAIDE